MKQKLLKLSALLGVLVLFGGISQRVLAEESVAPEEKTVATTETTGEVTPTESTVNSTTVSSEAEAVAETPVTKEEVKAVEEEVESLIKEKIGEKTGEDISLEDTYTPNDIRDMLINGGGGMSKEEVDKYTDAQLNDAMKLFNRYNYDISGMDPGALARLVKALYVDETLSVKDGLAQLSFNPASFNSFAAMIPQVDALQAYLKVLYPSNSSFIAGNTLSNEQLIAVLNHLEKFESKIKEEGGQLGAGRIAYILNSDQYDVSPDPTATSTNDTKKADVTPVSSSDPTKKDNQKGGLRLPQTGEEKAKWAVSILGIVLVIGVVLFVVKRKKTSKN